MTSTTTDSKSTQLLEEVLDELRNLNSRVNDYILSPERRYRDGESIESIEPEVATVISTVSTVTDEMLFGFQELWAETLARGIWTLEQYSPATIFRTVGERVAELQDA